MTRRVYPNGSTENYSEASENFNYDHSQYTYESSYAEQYQFNLPHSNISPDTQSYTGTAINPAPLTSFPIVQTSPIVHHSDSSYNYNPNAGSESWMAAFGSGGFENEPPLLDELGINFSHIKDKTLASLNPFRKLDSGTLNDADLTGPLLFCFLFGTSLLLTGKIHFGYIYGVATLGWISIFTILNLMAESGVSFYLTASVLGYCLLPMVLLSALAILLKLRGIIGLVLGITSVSWCTFSSSTYFVTAFGMQNQQILIGYPIFLLYSCFALMTIF